MPTLVLIAALSFNSQFECIQHLDNQLTSLPKETRVNRQNFNRTIATLYGGIAVLVCKGSKYEAYVMED